MPKKRKKLGLALGSGGVRGFTHIGVIKALIENDIPIDYISGSSIGSLIGAMFASGITTEEIENRLLNNKWDAFWSLFDPTLFSGGIVKGNKLEKLLDGWVETKNFRNLQIPLVTVAADLNTGKEVIFKKGNLITAIRASMAIPSLFKPVVFRNKLLIDGGLANPVPDDHVKAMGADVVIAVNLDYRIHTMNGDTNFWMINKVLKRSMDIIRHHFAKSCIQNSDIVITPKIDEPGIIGLKSYLSGTKAKGIIKTGYKLAEKLIPEIKKLTGI